MSSSTCNARRRSDTYAAIGFRDRLRGVCVERPHFALVGKPFAVEEPIAQAEHLGRVPIDGTSGGERLNTEVAEPGALHRDALFTAGEAGPLAEAHAEHRAAVLARGRLDGKRSRFHLVDR